MAARGEPVHRPAFAVAASEAASARTRARIEAAEGTLAQPSPDLTPAATEPAGGPAPPPGRRRGLFRRFLDH
jgi:hypothetical protein